MKVSNNWHSFSNYRYQPPYPRIFNHYMKKSYQSFLFAVKKFSQGNEWDNLIDIGCGLGHILISFAKNYPSKKFYGVDKSNSSIQQAIKKAKEIGIKNIRFCSRDVLKNSFPWPPSFSGIVISRNFFHNIDTKSKEQILIKMTECLKTPGMLIIIDPIFKDASERWKCSHVRSVLDEIEMKVKTLPARYKAQLKELAISEFPPHEYTISNPYNLIYTAINEYPEDENWWLKTLKRLGFNKIKITEVSECPFLKCISAMKNA